MIKVGLVGACNYSKIYAELISHSSNCVLAAVFENLTNLAQSLANYHQCHLCTSYEKLLEKCDTVVIIDANHKQFEYAKQAIKAQKHLFLKRSLFQNLASALELTKIAEEADVKIVVGQNERFNQAFISVQNKIKNPLYIETQRLVDIQNKVAITDVVADLMVPDIDLMLSLVKSNVKKVSANGLAVTNNKIDIANARVEFENGCIANLTANRIALKPVQKIVIYQKDAYINLNLLNRSAQEINLLKSKNGSNQLAYTIESGSQTSRKYIYNTAQNPIEINALQKEFEHFIYSIIKNIEPAVSIFDAYNALDLADQIIKKIKNNSIVAL